MIENVLFILWQYGALGVVIASMAFGVVAVGHVNELQDQVRLGQVSQRVPRDKPMGYHFYRRMPTPIWSRWLQRQLGDGT